MPFDAIIQLTHEHLIGYYNQLLTIFYNNPYHVIIETGLTLFIVWLLFIRKTVNPTLESKNRLSAKEQQWLVETWIPEPLVPKITPVDINIVEKVEGNYLMIRGIKGKVLNLNTFDFLGYSRLPAMKAQVQAALEKYGCGSCGPRGFYGTIDVHLEFEKQIALFMGTEEAISYSDSASTVSSSIPAFAKKGDLLLVDDACCEPVLTALTLSRSTVFFFKHNDMTDLRSILASIAEDDVLRKRDSKQQRRFIVVEGLYRNTGNICPLPELVQIKAEFCYRLIVDESLSFGVLGKTGRGVTDHFSLPATAVDILTVAMDTALASVGGVCLGTREIVDHQRLAGAGYCFSASAPPFLSAAALASLDALKTDPGVLGSLASVSKLLCAGVESLQGLERLSSEMSPVVHLVLSTQLDFEEELTVLEAVSKALLHRGVSAAVIKFPEDAIDRLITSGHRPTLRLIAHVGLSSSEITKAIASLQASVNEVIFKSTCQLQGVIMYQRLVMALATDDPLQQKTILLQMRSYDAATETLLLGVFTKHCASRSVSQRAIAFRALLSSSKIDGGVLQSALSDPCSNIRQAGLAAAGPTDLDFLRYLDSTETVSIALIKCKQHSIKLSGEKLSQLLLVLQRLDSRAKLQVLSLLYEQLSCSVGNVPLLPKELERLLGILDQTCRQLNSIAVFVLSIKCVLLLLEQVPSERARALGRDRLKNLRQTAIENASPERQVLIDKELKAILF